MIFIKTTQLFAHAYTFISRNDVMPIHWKFCQQKLALPTFFVPLAEKTIGIDKKSYSAIMLLAAPSPKVTIPAFICLRLDKKFLSVVIWRQLSLSRYQFPLVEDLREVKHNIASSLKILHSPNLFQFTLFRTFIME